MIYNLTNPINVDVIKNGVYESLHAPGKGIGIGAYLDLLDEELKDCPFIHCPDYNLLVPISEEIYTSDGDNIITAIHKIAYSWWTDENRV